MQSGIHPATNYASRTQLDGRTDTSIVVRAWNGMRSIVGGSYMAAAAAATECGAGAGTRQPAVHISAMLKMASTTLLSYSHSCGRCRPAQHGVQPAVTHLLPAL